MDCPNYGAGNCGSTPTTTVTSVGIGRSTHTSPSALPFTGGDVAGLGFAGVMLVAAGVAFVRRGRRASA